ncbi:unnamed protein product [Caenorhabditis angaria]|uniref:Uncharacterized protein n=1 Tax=Caenorhabditis angaria TaxID=860376 RepID=A0A9P1IL75_9PELO|nr:unnamed protein product [Caenorhabditis angaria]
MEQHFSDVISIDLKIQISKVKLEHSFSNLELFWMYFDGANYNDSWCMFGRFSKLCKSCWTKHVLIFDKQYQSILIGSFLSSVIGQVIFDQSASSFGGNTVSIQTKSGHFLIALTSDNFEYRRGN